MKEAAPYRTFQTGGYIETPFKTIAGHIARVSLKNKSAGDRSFVTFISEDDHKERVAKNAAMQSMWMPVDQTVEISDDQDAAFRIPETGRWWVYPTDESIVVALFSSPVGVKAHEEKAFTVSANDQLRVTMADPDGPRVKVTHFFGLSQYEAWKSALFGQTNPSIGAGQLLELDAAKPMGYFQAQEDGTWWVVPTGDVVVDVVPAKD